VAGPLALLGVPTSAGTHGPGQEKAPGALRAAGLAGALAAAGVEVHDEGDLPVAMYRAAVAELLDRGMAPLVLGGDCTITLGVAAGFARYGDDLGLLYFDGDADLSTPATTGSGGARLDGRRPLAGRGGAGAGPARAQGPAADGRPAGRRSGGRARPADPAPADSERIVRYLA
jgi:arginase